MSSENPTPRRKPNTTSSSGRNESGTPSASVDTARTRKILLVDVDGTLTDSFPGIRDSFLHALDNNGIERPSDTEIQRIPGPPMSETLAGLGLKGELLEKALQDYLQHQAGGGWLNAAAFPGMKDLLAKWRAKEIILSTATSKSKESARRILEHFGMLQYFHVLAAADPSTGRQGKAMVIDYALEQLQELPELNGSDEHGNSASSGTLNPANILLIGDRIHDVEGAAQHGIDSVLVGWGYGDDSERARASHYVATPEQLDALVERWIDGDAGVSASHKVKKITVVCTGNICRSPIGDVMLNKALSDAGMNDVVVNSCGLGGWHVGEGADPRAVRELDSFGYDGSAHRAAQVGEEHLDADVFLAMDRGHVRGLKGLGVDPAKIYLFRAFDPDSFDATSDADNVHSLRAPEVSDPYYSEDAAFTEVAEQIEAAVPGIVEYFLR